MKCNRYCNYEIILFSVLITVKVIIFHHVNKVDLWEGTITTTFGLLLFASLLSSSFKNRYKIIYLSSLNFTITILLLANTLYYNYYGSPLTIYTALQYQNLSGLRGSILYLFRPQYTLFFLDLLVMLVILTKFKSVSFSGARNKRYTFFIYFLVGLILVGAAPVRMYQVYKTNPFERYEAVTYMNTYGILAHHFLDTYMYFKENKSRRLTQSQKEEIRVWFDQKNKTNNQSTEESNYRSVGKNKNLIVIQVESLQNFVINKTIDGQQITPNLNKVLKNSIYFPNFYPQTAEGNSADAEFITQTSLYPLSTGAVYFRYPFNKYFALPKTLKRSGYDTIVFHADERTFWNRNNIYPNIGFDTYKALDNFKLTEEIGMGLSDKAMFRQSLGMLKKLREPYYAFYITLTSHAPFEMSKKYSELKLGSNLQGTNLGNYLQSVRYTDESIGFFLRNLDKQGILEKSIVVIYGDHDGMLRKDIKLVSEVWDGNEIDNERWVREYVPVPLIIYNPEIKEDVRNIVGGQVDFFPTLKAIMDPDDKNNEYMMGRDLLTSKEGFAIIPKGGYSPKAYYITDNNILEISPEQKKALEISNLIIQGNYFREASKGEDR